MRYMYTGLLAVNGFPIKISPNSISTDGAYHGSPPELVIQHFVVGEPAPSLPWQLLVGTRWREKGRGQDRGGEGVGENMRETEKERSRREERK